MNRSNAECRGMLNNLNYTDKEGMISDADPGL